MTMSALTALGSTLRGNFRPPVGVVSAGIGNLFIPAASEIAN